MPNVCYLFWGQAAEWDLVERVRLSWRRETRVHLPPDHAQRVHVTAVRLSVNHAQLRAAPATRG